MQAAATYMMEMQAKYKKEISALMVINSDNQNLIIVQPWEDNTEHSAEGWNRGVVPGEGFKRAVIKGRSMGVVGSVHTHPPGGNYEGPSGPGNAYYGGDGDYGVYQNLLNQTNMFIIGPTEVSKLNPQYPFRSTIWSDEKEVTIQGTGIKYFQHRT